MRQRHRSTNQSSPAKMHGIVPRIAILVTAALLLAASAMSQELANRRPLPKVPVKALAPPPGTPTFLVGGSQYRLVVKFRDEVQARTARGSLTSLAAADMTGAEGVARAFSMSFSPLIKLPEEQLTQLKERAAARSLVAQPDLAGVLKVAMPGAGSAELEAAGEALQRLPEVEFAYIQTLGVPPPHDISPPTLAYVNKQTYFGPDPGIDADYAWAQGFTGAGIRLSDCEYGWNYDHEDLHDKNLHPEPGQTIHPSVEPSYIDHGTAVLGETSGVVNNYGVSGLVPDAEIYTYPEVTLEAGGDYHRRVEAITAAIVGSSFGDVVLLEMQTAGAGRASVPAEFDRMVWMVVKMGTDAGVIVVAAAGNGNQDLDSAFYKEYMARGDSGAIIVGAGSSDVNHNKLSFSTYGSRVDVQGWGEKIFTLGYGNFAELGGDENQRYRHDFGGTSGASSFVAAAAVALQDAANSSLSPQGMRDLLIKTGIPQGSGGHIGPSVDLRAAISRLFNNPPTCQDDKFTTPQDIGFTILFADLLSDDSDPDGDNLYVVDYDQVTEEGGMNDFGHPLGFNYTPPSGFVGTDWFSYTIADRGDGTGLTDTCSVSVDVELPDQPPTPAFAATCNIVRKCTFDASASSDDIGIVSYKWNFGDGSPEVETTEPIITHRFPQKGDYTVTLTGTDTGSQSASAQQITQVEDLTGALITILGRNIIN